MAKEVTERDVQTARNLNAPSDVIASLEKGEWPSDASKNNVRYSQEAEDHLHRRYGVNFTAKKASLDSGFVVGDALITLTVDDGPYAGEEVQSKIYMGDAENYKDSYPYLVYHAQYDAVLDNAVQAAFGDISSDASAIYASMDNKPYSEFDLPGDASDLATVGSHLTGAVRVYLAPELKLSESELDSRTQKLIDELATGSVRVDYQVTHIIKPTPEGESFTEEYASDLMGTAGKNYDYHKTGLVDAE